MSALKKSEIIHINTLHLLSEDSLLSAMEHAGAEDMGDDVERKGLGTPATRADVIEKLVKNGFVKWEKKQMIPTEDGVKLIAVLPDAVKSPKLTADWENALTLVAKGEYSMQAFMDGIADLVNGLVQTYHSVSDEQKSMFGGSTQDSSVRIKMVQVKSGKIPKKGYNKRQKGWRFFMSRHYNKQFKEDAVKYYLEHKELGY